MTQKLIKYSVAVSLFAALTTPAQAQKACQETPGKVSVAPNRLDNALTELTTQLGCPVSYDPTVVRQFRSGPVKGNLTPSDALIRLVRGTGLEVHMEQSKLRIDQTDQEAIGLQAATLQATLGQAVKSQKLDQNTANRLYAELSEVRTSVVQLAKQQGFVSAAEKASYARTFDKAGQLLARSK